jgi:uroporphyrin-III C-methyltransferase/precorrin-2 dehydrogenase/sirohydrochlorin ferrochelatase
MIGTGPGDPDLLTVKARRLIHEADVVLHDRLVPQEIIELARREAIIVETGKTGFGPSWKQEDINALMVSHAANGAQVARLKSGDPGMFGRLDEELDALDAAGIAWNIVPGITAAAAAAASSGLSLTKRGRNASVRFLTGHDTQGFAEHDWRDLARPGAGAAIYMGVKAAGFLRGRLLAHGADADTPVTAVENASRPGQKTIATTIHALPDALDAAGISGPAVLLYGMAARKAATFVRAAANPIHETAGVL